MAIIRKRDPYNLMLRWPWVGLWEDEDMMADTGEGLSVYETDNDVIVKAHIPGVPSDKVDVSVEGGVVTIKAAYEETEEEKKKKKVVYREARRSQYYYTTSIPCPVKTDKVVAEVKDGVLTVTLPKKEAAKPKKITVKPQSK